LSRTDMERDLESADTPRESTSVYLA
jgi:hypothetical protein